MCDQIEAGKPASHAFGEPASHRVLGLKLSSLEDY